MYVPFLFTFFSSQKSLQNQVNKKYILIWFRKGKDINFYAIIIRTINYGKILRKISPENIIG